VLAYGHASWRSHLRSEAAVHEQWLSTGRSSKPRPEQALSARDDGSTTRMIPFPTDRLDAVIFDMDGVVSDTARVHQRCWRLVFDDYLRRRTARPGEDLRPFHDEDYVRYVDGKPRYDGVESFLASRHISLPRGTPSDPPGEASMCALGNLKDRDFEQTVAEDGVSLFDSTIVFIRTLRAYGIRTALISSSRHARVILEAVHITNLFDAIVDGIDAEALGLPGKPDPAIFVSAAQRLNVAPARAAVVEDALAGVEAGHQGGFGFVIGIGIGSHADELLDHGASVVVADMSEFELGSDIAKEPL
jgi:alpha,alpha-trehalase